MDLKLVSLTLTRIGEKLPANSGLPCFVLENDALFVQNVTSIVNLAPYRINHVLNSLTTLLDSFSKGKQSSFSQKDVNSSSPGVFNLDDNSISIEILQSQLFVLRLMGFCLAIYWRSFRDKSNKKAERIEKSKLSFLTQPFVGSADFTADQSLSEFPDPPPLDEHLSKNVIASITKYFHTTVSTMNADFVTHSFSSFSTGNYSDYIGAIPISNICGPNSSVAANTTNLAAFYLNPCNKMDVDDPNEADNYDELYEYFPSNVEVLSQLAKSAGRVMFFLSSSNWPVVFQRIRLKLFHISQWLANDKGADSATQVSGDYGDFTEFRFIEWCNLNKLRLGMVLAELCNVTRTFPKRAMFITAIVLRRAIWNFIETYPADFAALIQSQKRMDGNPDILFEIFYSSADSHRKKILYWPLQTLLLILCPDILSSIGASHSNNIPLVLAANKNVEIAKKFFENLKKSFKISKFVDISIFCLVEICKASTFCPKNDGMALRMIIPNMETELKERLFDQNRTVNQMEKTDENILDIKVLNDALTALYRLNPFTTLRTLVPFLLEWSAPVVFKVLLVKCGYTIVSEENITKDNLTQAKLPSNANKKISFGRKNDKKSHIEDTYDRLEVIANVLKIWCCRPLLAVAKDTTIIGAEELRLLLAGISSCLSDPIRTIREKASEAILKIFEPEFVKRWDGSIKDWRFDDVSDIEISDSSLGQCMKVYWKISSQVLLSISKQLMEIKGDLLDPQALSPFFAKPLMLLVVELLKKRNEFLRSRIASFKGVGTIAAALGIVSYIPERFGASVSLEMALLIFICCSDLEISNTATYCLGLMMDEAELTGEAKSSESNLAELNTNQEFGGNDADSSKRTGSISSGTPAMSTVAENSSVYQELRKLSQGTNITISGGQKAQQKRIRKILRSVNKATAGNMGAWEEVYKRWKTLSVIHNTQMAYSGNNGNDEDLDATKRKKGFLSYGNIKSQSEFVEDKGDWQNYTGFLAALGGVCLNVPASQNPNSSLTTSPTLSTSNLSPSVPLIRKSSMSSNLTNTAPSRRQSALNNLQDASSPSTPNYLNGDYSNWKGSAVGSQLMGAFANSNEKVDTFLAEMVELSIGENVVVREAVKDLLGNELNSGLYGILFKHISNLVDRFFVTEGETFSHEKNTLFVENCISILKLILERAEELSPDHLFKVDFGGLILSFIQYVNQLGKFNQTVTALRIKVKMCQLVEVLVGKKDTVGLRQEIRLRNRLVEIFLSWNSEFSLNEVLDVKNFKLYRDLDLACIKVMIPLLSELPLQPSNVENLKGESGPSSALSSLLVLDQDFDSTPEKGILFNKYLSFFLKVLQKCKMSESHQIRNINNERTEKIADTVQYYSLLKKLSILALSNMLSANIEIGLKYSLSMGYHEDSKTRAAFMQVMTNILNLGSSEQFARLGEEGLVILERYEKLLDLIMEQDLTLALALCEAAPVTDIDGIAQMFLKVFEAKGKSFKLLKVVVESEVNHTDSPANLFRRNSMATRLLTNYAKAEGAEYLLATLKPLMEDLIDRKSDISFEMDPTRMGPNDVAENNLNNLKLISQGFLDAIIGNVSKVPFKIREVCSYISYIVAQRFPDARVAAVGGFIFLRFFCPALVAPETTGLIGSQYVVSKELRRGLILITKVIQNLANNVLFGIKESFMAGLNDVLRENIVRVHSYLREVSTIPSDHLQFRSPPVNNKIEEVEFMRLHRYLTLNLDKMERILVGGSKIESDDQKNVLPRKKLFAQLSTLLARLGSPPDLQKIESSLQSKSIASDSSTKGIISALTTGNSKSQFYTDFLTKVENRSGYMKYVGNLRNRKVFFEEGVSKERRPVLYYICRRVLPGSLDIDIFVYFFIISLKSVANKPFDLVVDCTQFSGVNGWGDDILNLMEKIFPLNFEQNLQCLYFYNVNSAFRKYSKKLAKFLKDQRKIFLNNLQEFTEFIGEVNLPKSTLSLERDATAVSPVTRLFNYRDHIPVIFKISNEIVQVVTLKPSDILGTQAILNDIWHLSEIEDASISTRSSNDNEFVVRYVEKISSYKLTSSSNTSVSTAIFSSPKRDLIIQMLKAAKLRFQSSRQQNFLADRRHLSPSDVPGLCIPANNQHFVVYISKGLAVTSQHLTLEFLIECCIGFMKSSKELKHYCLEYMAPWLPNLSNYCRSGMLLNSPTNDVQQQKLKEVIRLLIEITIKETEMYPLIQSNIWQSLGEIEEIVPLVLELFIQSAVEGGVGSSTAEVAANTVITLASVNLHHIPGKIISRLRRIISSTSQHPTASLVDHPAMGEIAVLLRFILMLSFNNNLNVTQFLPELWHIVSILIGVGSPLIRSSIHVIVVNIVHSLCTRDLSEMHLNTLKVLLTSLSEPKMCLLFGTSVGGDTSEVFLLNSDSVSKINQREIPLSSVEMVLNCLLDVISFGTSDPGDVFLEISAIWKSRWMSLIASTAFQYNPAIQPRAFMALGCLAQNDVDNDLLYQVLVALRGALTLFEDNDCGLIVSIVMSLCNIVGGLTLDSIFLKPMFWLAFSLVQIGHVPIFHASLSLLQVVIKRLDELGAFQDEGVSNLLMKIRSPFTEILGQLDSTVGIHFQTDVSFAISINLMKGLRHKTTKSVTNDVLTLLLELSGKHCGSLKVGLDRLGYIIPLLPSSDKIKNLFWFAGIHDSEADIYLMNGNNNTTWNRHKRLLECIADDVTISTLTICTMATMLEYSENESEMIFIYGFLAEAAQIIPDAFILISESILPRMSQVVTNNQNSQILDSIQSILKTVVSLTPESIPSAGSRTSVTSVNRSNSKPNDLHNQNLNQ
ncbi:Ras GTPase activating protein ira2, partial [Clydaea vesicula]